MSQDYRASYLALVAAIERYDAALKRWAILGDAWQDHSDELDDLYYAVLRAAGLPVPTNS